MFIVEPKILSLFSLDRLIYADDMIYIDISTYNDNQL